MAGCLNQTDWDPFTNQVDLHLVFACAEGIFRHECTEPPLLTAAIRERSGQCGNCAIDGYCQVTAPANPYEYLPQFLTAEQIDEVERLPKMSPQQVDKIIEFVDEDEACDDEIRQLAYELFRRAPD